MKLSKRNFSQAFKEKCIPEEEVKCKKKSDGLVTPVDTCMEGWPLFDVVDELSYFGLKQG